MKKLLPFIFILLVSGLNAKPLTLPEFRRLTLANNPSIRQQQAAISAAEYNLKVKKSAFLPKISAGATAGYASEVNKLSLTTPLFNINKELGSNDTYDFKAVVSQPVFTGFRLQAEKEAASLSVKSEEEQQAAVHNHLIMMAESQWWGVQSLLCQQQTLIVAQKRLQIQLQSQRAMVKTGQIASPDTLALFNLWLNNQNQQQILEAQVQAGLWGMADIAGLRYKPEVLPDKDLPVVSIASLDWWENQGLNKRPELQRLKTESNANAKQKTAAESAYWPQISANGEYHYGMPGITMRNNEWDDYFQLGISLNWLVWDFDASKNKARQVDQIGRQLSEQFNAQEQSILEDIRTQWELLPAFSEQIDYKQRICTNEEQRCNYVSDQFKRGQTSALDVRNAEEDLTKAELELIKARLDWRLQYVKLMAAAGLL